MVVAEGGFFNTCLFDALKSCHCHCNTLLFLSSSCHSCFPLLFSHPYLHLHPRRAPTGFGQTTYRGTSVFCCLSRESFKLLVQVEGLEFRVATAHRRYHPSQHRWYMPHTHKTFKEKARNPPPPILLASAVQVISRKCAHSGMSQPGRGVTVRMVSHKAYSSNFLYCFITLSLWSLNLIRY